MNPSPGIAGPPARILIVDDDRQSRQLLECMLAPEGFLLLTAASGEEALALVAQQPPDLILLDIMMPGMNGYQVTRTIKGNAATRNIPVMMVSALDDPNARMLGLSAGAEDFLTKPVDRAELCWRARNLLRFEGDRLHPSKLLAAPAGHFHAVTFYSSRESLSRIVAEFLGEGMIAQQPALVVATPEHRESIVAGLRARHFDVDAMQLAGDLLLLDASAMLSSFMADGMPDPELFNAIAARAIEQMCRGRKGCTIRVYGDLVNVLRKNGQDVAAIRLEMLWNRLATTHDFFLLCGYAMASFDTDASFSDVRNQHSHVVSASGAVSRAQAHRATITIQ